MCGIAGYSLSARSGVDRTLAAQALLAAIAERGADAVGYATRPSTRESASTSSAPARARSSTTSRSRPTRPRSCSTCATTRRATRGSRPTTTPSATAPRSASTTGSSSTTRTLLARHGMERAEPEMTVDSEAIFALVDRFGASAHGPRRAARLHGDRRLDERKPGSLHLARGIGRPLWIGSTRTRSSSRRPRQALEIVERYLGLRLRKREVGEGAIVELAHGTIGRPDGSSRIARSARAGTSPPCAHPASATSASACSRRSPPSSGSTRPCPFRACPGARHCYGRVTFVSRASAKRAC